MFRKLAALVYAIFFAATFTFPNLILPLFLGALGLGVYFILKDFNYV